MGSTLEVFKKLMEGLEEKQIQKNRQNIAEAEMNAAGRAAPAQMALPPGPQVLALMDGSVNESQEIRSFPAGSGRPVLVFTMTFS